MSVSDGNLHTVLGLGNRISHVDRDLCGESLLADIVCSLGIIGCYRTGGFCRVLVEGNLKREHFTCAG